MNGQAMAETSDFSAAAPLTDLLQTYTQCLTMSREYMRGPLNEFVDDEVDTDALQQFLNARADLFSVAEVSFNALAACPQDDNDEAKKELTKRVLSVLEELTEIEGQLADFLGDRLNKLRGTINDMKRAQPVFKRYGNLGGKIHPSRITRHE